MQVLVVGSGPYKLKSHTPKSNTAFEAFEAYNGPSPYGQFFRRDVRYLGAGIHFTL